MCEEGLEAGFGEAMTRGRKKLETTTVLTTPLFSTSSYQNHSVFFFIDKQFCILIVAGKQSPFTFMHRHLKKNGDFFFPPTKRKNTTFLSRKEMKSKSLPK